jgi:uncharacterized membrane protein
VIQEISMTTMAVPQAAAAPAAVPAPALERIQSIDFLRGVVMVVMVLDHVRDYVHGGAFRFNPTDLSQTTVVLFMTRWVTHYCAPVFVFLAGVGAGLQTLRGKSHGELAKFLLTRGVWLVVLEVSVLRICMWFNVDYRFLSQLQVIWVIGLSMVVLAALVRVPATALAIGGLVMIAGHNMLDGIQVMPWGGPGTPAPALTSQVWMLLHQPGQLFPLFTDGPLVFVIYPLVPWVGVMAVGYAFAQVYAWESDVRRRFLVRLGLGLIATFIVLRAIDVYGDPAPWHVERNAIFTVLSFINTTKYPPSLLYLLMTLGPALVVLGVLEARSQRASVTGPFVMLGRVPLFFYLLQWPVAHGIAVILNLAAGKQMDYLFHSVPEFYSLAPPDAGFDLWVAYVAWAVAVALLFVMCRWFAGVRRRRRDWWLAYL